MRVSLGTVEVDDDVRKAIRESIGGKGHATRGDVKDYALDVLNRHFKLLVAGDVEPEPASAEIQTEWAHEAPGAGGGELPEPTSAGDSTPPAGTGTTPGF